MLCMYMCLCVTVWEVHREICVHQGRKLACVKDKSALEGSQQVYILGLVYLKRHIHMMLSRWVVCIV